MEKSTKIIIILLILVLLNYWYVFVHLDLNRNEIIKKSFEVHDVSKEPCYTEFFEQNGIIINQTVCIESC